MDEVSPMFMPSQYQRAMWWHLIMDADGVDLEGNWLGWCAIHDKDHDSDVATAQFNFRKGVMRCLGEPSCHEGKRALSLANVMVKMAGGSSGG